MSLYSVGDKFVALIVNLKAKCIQKIVITLSNAVVKTGILFNFCFLDYNSQTFCLGAISLYNSGVFHSELISTYKMD